MELRIPLQTSLQIMWFLCGSTWFQQCQNAGTCLFRVGQTMRNNVVLMWFRVVPTMMTWPRFPSNHVAPVWFSVPPTNADAGVLQPANKTFLAGCGPLLDASSALTKGGQVMFCPQPLLELPCKAERWQRAHESRTSNVSPSTITCAP